jgi:ribonuclease-3
LDGAADAAIGRLYAGEVARIDPAELAKDPKTRLQELLQGRKLPVPDYAVAAVRGEAHLQTFDVVCRIPALDITATGSGPSRRAAEQAAAAAAYEQAARA